MLNSISTTVSPVWIVAKPSLTNTLQIIAALSLVAFLSCVANADNVDLGESTIQLVDGTQIKATINSIDREGNVGGSNIPDGLIIEQVLSLKTDRTTERDESHRVSILVLGGGRIFASNPEFSSDHVTFRSGSGIGKLTLQSARAIVWSKSPMVESKINEPSRENDTVIVSTSDGERSVEGILESIDADFVGINYKGESRKIGIAKVKAIVTADLAFSDPPGPEATIQLVDESILIGAIVGLADGRLTLDVADDTQVDVRSSNVAGITIASDRLLYLSDVDPVEVQEKAIFAVQRPWQRDQSVENNPLKIRKARSEQTVSFNKGLGTQSLSRLVYANTNNFDRFVAVAGIDAETKGRGDCEMIVRGDGIELWSRRVRGSDGPLDIDVDITGIKQVVLLVNPGQEFDLGDHADWCDARFVKTK